MPKGINEPALGWIAWMHATIRCDDAHTHRAHPQPNDQRDGGGQIGYKPAVAARHAFVTVVVVRRAAHRVIKWCKSQVEFQQLSERPYRARPLNLVPAIYQDGPPASDGRALDILLQIVANQQDRVRRRVEPLFDELEKTAIRFRK